MLGSDLCPRKLYNTPRKYTDYHLRLDDINLTRCREIIDVPPPTTLKLTEHLIYKG